MAFAFMMSTHVAPGPGAPSPAPRRRPDIGDRPRGCTAAPDPPAHSPSPPPRAVATSEQSCTRARVHASTHSASLLAMTKESRVARECKLALMAHRHDCGPQPLAAG